MYIPPALTKALENGELIICVGPDLARRAGLPSMVELAESLIEDAEASGRSLDTATLRAWLATGQVERTLEALDRHMGARFQRVVERELGERGRPVPELARAIAALEDQLRAVYTTGVDRLLERAFRDTWPSFATAQGDLTRRRKLIVKLCGTLEFPETLVLTQAALEREFGGRSLRRGLFSAAGRAHCLLFLGFAVDDALAERLFAIITDGGPEVQGPSHFMVVESCSSAEQARFENRGLRVIQGDPLALLRALGPDRDVSRHCSGTELPLCPYPGLEKFDRSLASVFHGRRAEISAAASHLGGPPSRHRRWLAVDGSSGVGKSSFVHAGLIPALERGFAEGTLTRWTVASMRPGRRPLEALVESLTTAFSTRDQGRLGHDFQDTGDTPSQVAAFVRANTSPRTEVLLIIDQLEEVVTLAAPAERELFAACVSTLLGLELIYLVTTLRADFTAALSASMPAFARALNEQAQRYTLAPISRVGLRAAIAEPAAQLGVRFEAELVERIASDAQHHLGYRSGGDRNGVVRTDDAALPLVAHVLRGLWDARAADDGEISFAEYEALGRVSGALSRSADSLLATLDGPQHSRAKALLLRMVNLDDGRLTRRTLRQSEAVELAGGTAHGGGELMRLLCGGGGPRLLVVREEGGEVLVDLVHEALLREWGTLRGWIAEDRVQLARDEALARRAASWHEQGRSRRSLPRGPERRGLLHGRTHGRNAKTQREYQRAMRSAAWVRVGLGVGLGVVIAGAGWGGFTQLREIEREKREAEKGELSAENEVREKEDENRQAQTKIDNNKTRDSVRTHLEEGRCRAALFQLVDELPDDPLLREAVRCEAVVGKLAYVSAAAEETAFALGPRGDYAWLARSNGDLQRWNLDDHRVETIVNLKRPPDEVVIAPNASVLALRSGNQVRLADDEGQAIGSPFKGRYPRFSPDSGLLATKTGNRLEVRSTDDGEVLWKLADTGGNDTFEFSTANLLVVGHAQENGSTVYSLDTKTGTYTDRTIDVPRYLRDLALNPGDSFVATIADDGLTRRSDLDSDERIVAPRAYVGVGTPTRRISVLSPRGSLLASTSDDTKIVVADRKLTELYTLEDLDLDIRPQFSPDDRWLLTADFEDRVALRAAETGEPAAQVVPEGKVARFQPFTAPRPKRLELLIQTDRDLGHWAVDTQDHWRAPTRHKQGVHALAFSPESHRTLLSGSSAGTVRSWTIGAQTQPPALNLPGWVIALGFTASTSPRARVAFSNNGDLSRWPKGATPGTQRARGMCGANHASISSSGERLALACDDGSVQLWAITIAHNELLATLTPTDAAEIAPGQFASISLSPSGAEVALGTREGAIVRLRVRGQALAPQPGTPHYVPAHTGSVTSLAFTSEGDGETLVSCGVDKAIRRWTGSATYTVELFTSSEKVSAVAASHTHIAAGDESGAIQLRDMEGTLIERFDLACGHTVSTVAFSGDGQVLAAGCSDGSVHAWPVTQAAQLELACQRLANTSGGPADIPDGCSPHSTRTPKL